MRLALIAFGLIVLDPLIEPPLLRGDDTVVNIPVLAGRLRGEWELRPTDGRAFQQRLRLGGSVEGSWQQSRETLPVTIAWFVEVDGDQLALTRDGVTQGWRRVSEAAAASPSP